MYKRTEEVEPSVGLPRHIHFIGFFNVSVQALTRYQSFNAYSECHGQTHSPIHTRTSLFPPTLFCGDKKEVNTNTPPRASITQP